jgi:membrane peptidoglycan carboxypeptidase
MNPSYGDSNNAAHGRARIPGQDDGYGDRGDDPGNGYDPYGDAGRRSSPGRASVGGSAGSARVPTAGASASADQDDWSGRGGRATVRPRDGYGDEYTAPAGRGSGRASVGGASVGGGSAGRASVGGGSAGRASVGGSSGRASVGSASVGSASVGSAAVGNGYDGGASGRATVGRASVGPDRGPGSGGPGGPNGPNGPRGRGTAGRPGGKKQGGKKRHLRRNIILSACALLVIISGGIVVGGTYYFDSVKMPNQLPVPDQSTTIYYSDNATVMAKIGNQNRTYVGIDQIPKGVQEAVVAAEDNTFYTNSGVSYRGVIRAAWNNLTGGDRQGASTITQQYARKMLDLEGVSYARKLREAVIAMKLSKNYSKDAIMEAYLNTVYFGRGAYGIEAAAQAYFGKSAKSLTPAEGMLLAAVIKQPEPADLNNPSVSPGYDPAYGLKESQDRWGNYIKPIMAKFAEDPAMIKLGFLSAADVAKLQYPTDWKPPSAASAGTYGLDLPTGFVVHQVMSELTQQKDVPALADPKELKTGGFRIVTTIDKTMEQNAINFADDKLATSPVHGQPSNLQASLVSIQPGTGRVLAYYGGENGANLDYAGIYNDPVTLQPGDTPGWSGANFPPGSTFKMYTLATALSQGYSIDSYWNGPPTKEFPAEGRVKGSPAGPVSNAAGDEDSCPNYTYPTPYVCDLQLALQESMNTVYYGVGEKVGAGNIVAMAKAMGVEHLWDNDGKRFDLDNYTTAAQLKDLDSHFGTEVAIGQFGTTVLDNASGVATIAARGIQTQTHFVETVYQGANVVYKEAFKQTNLANSPVHLTPQEVDDETYAMTTVIKGTKNALANGRVAAAKTGTWQLGQTKNNSQAWYAGFTPQVATVVHIGSRDPKNLKIQYYNSSHKLMDMNGADLPGTIWKKYMDTVLKSDPKKTFPQAKHVGDAQKGPEPSPIASPQAPPPVQDPTDPGQPCVLPQFCQQPPGQNQNRNGGQGGQGGGGGQPTLTPTPPQGG